MHPERAKRGISRFCRSPAQPLVASRVQVLSSRHCAPLFGAAPGHPASGFQEEAFTPLTLTSRPQDDHTIVYCAGSLILGEEADALRNLVRKLLPDSRVIILDLAGITMMDSAGVGTLVGLSFSARNAGINLKLARPSARIYTLLQLTRLGPVFDIVDKPESAAAAGNGTP